jgi:hypothetical protein
MSLLKSNPDDTYASMQLFTTRTWRQAGLAPHPAKSLVEVYRQSADSDILTGADTLQGEAVARV